MTDPRKYVVPDVSDELLRIMANYPAWVCMDCGKKYGRCLPDIATWHEGKCGICDTTGPVTEPRDFGHLRAR